MFQLKKDGVVLIMQRKYNTKYHIPTDFEKMITLKNGLDPLYWSVSNRNNEKDDYLYVINRITKERAKIEK